MHLGPGSILLITWLIGENWPANEIFTDLGPTRSERRRKASNNAARI